MSTTKEWPSGFDVFKKLKMPVAANFKALKGVPAAIALSGASEGRVTEGTNDPDLLAIGRFGETIDNTGGAAGAKEVEVVFPRAIECIRLLNSESDPVTVADVGKVVYWADNNTATSSPTGSSPAGICWYIDPDDLMVRVEPTLRFPGGLGDAGEASGVSIDDTGSLFVGTDVEAALAELANNVAFLPIPIKDFSLAANGAPLIVFNDGVADGLDFSEGQSYRFNPNSTAAIGVTVPMPPDLDDAEDVEIHVLASRVGSSDTTAVVTVTAFFQTVGAAHDADVNAGGNTGAIAGATTVVAELTRTIAAADVPAAPCALSFTLVPSAALDADDLRIHAVWLEYQRKNIAA